MDMTSLGETFRQARGTMSQPELERATGVRQNVISAIENGRYKNLTDNHRIIATHFGIDLPDDAQEEAETIAAAPCDTAPNMDATNGALEPSPRNAVLFRSIEHLKEIDVLGRCCLDLQSLDVMQRIRILRYLNDLFGEAAS